MGGTSVCLYADRNNLMGSGRECNDVGGRGNCRSKILRNVGGKKKQVPGGGTGLHRHRETSFIVTPMLLCL